MELDANSRVCVMGEADWDCPLDGRKLRVSEPEDSSLLLHRLRAVVDSEW